MIFKNPLAQRISYPNALYEILNAETAHECARWLAQWPELNPGPTPLWSLPALANKLGIAELVVKDESKRSKLLSFKALGAPVALLRLIQRQFPEKCFEAVNLLQGRHADLLKEFAVVSATDGNHGRALAAVARSVGCRCVIVLHENVSMEREAPIAALGAQIVRIRGNYDASVTAAARLARENGWEVVSDTSYEGYEEVPRDVMQGYATIAAEIILQTNAKPATPGRFSHVILQGGVGGLAAGVASYFWEHHGPHRPNFIVAEPLQADCLYQSAALGKAAKATGTVDSVMAGLACGEASPLAWRFLAPSIDYFQVIQDGDAVGAMRLAAAPVGEDVPMVMGESGAAGLAALLSLRESDSTTEVGLDEKSRVLIINTEGATAPSIYALLAGEAAADVELKQLAWMARTTRPSSAT